MANGSGLLEGLVVASDGSVRTGRLGAELRQMRLATGVSCAAWSLDGHSLAYAVGNRVLVSRQGSGAQAAFSTTVESTSEVCPCQTLRMRNPMHLTLIM